MRTPKTRRRDLLKGILAAAAAPPMLNAMPAALAQGAYPNRPIKLVVGFAPGGPTDILARVIGKGMSDVLGEQVVIENRTGAGGNIGTDAVARSAPDGYTLLLTLLTGAVNESLFKNFKVRFAEHFDSVGGIAQTGLVLVVHPSLPVKSVSDFINYGKSAKPGELFYATAGAGTSTHLAAELFNSVAGIKMTPVHYRGGGDTIKDLISGRMPVMFSTIPPVLGFVRDGQLRGIATTGSKRDFALPELPTFVESGLPDFDVPLWFGLIAPKGTPPSVVQTLNKALARTMATAETKKVFEAQGFMPMPMGPEQFAKFYVAEAERWGKVVHALGLSQ
ncbi:MAG: tripartite tricarboxylate transporter substrate binding protein [Xanthobacteraceae bacterium]|nr:tripartite tricarboxylate transporter substrate binding protein [Xanthobacteraceae bacterium]